MLQELLMFGRKLKDFSIVVNILSPHPEGVAALLGEALEIVELSPALRTAPVCWVLSTNALSCLSGEAMRRVRRRVDNYGDTLATSGYHGLPHGALHRPELATEVAWAFHPPTEFLTGGPHRDPHHAQLFFPREPDGRYAGIDRGIDAVSAHLEGVVGRPDAEGFALRFYTSAGQVDLPARFLSTTRQAPEAPTTPRGKRKALQTLLPAKSAYRRWRAEEGVVVIELMYQSDTAMLRLFADSAEKVTRRAAIRPIAAILTPNAVESFGAYRGRRAPADEKAFLAAAEARAAGGAPDSVLQAMQTAYCPASPDPGCGDSALPLRRDLAANMAGHAELDEGDLRATFEDGRVATIRLGERTLMAGTPARSWATVGDEVFELSLSDAISFQNDRARGLRSTFRTPQSSPISVSLLVDALVLEGTPVLFMECYLRFGQSEVDEVLTELVPLCLPSIPIVGKESQITCRYPDGETHIRHLRSEGKSPSRIHGIFGSRFTVSDGGSSVSVAYLHPSKRYVGEASAAPSDGGCSLCIGPLYRGIPLSAVNGLAQRFLIAVGDADVGLPGGEWPEDFGSPGLWVNTRDGEVER